MGLSSGPYAVNGGVRIRYRTAGRAGGEAVFLVHDFFGSLEDWYDYGYVDALGDAYRLVLVDARGHGDSDQPPDPAFYSRETRARDVVAVMGAEGIAAAHFVGYSKGGWIGLGLLRWHAERLKSAVLDSIHP